MLSLAATASLGSGVIALTHAAEAEPPPSENPPSDRTLGTREYNVRDFGAKGDGKNLDTEAVQAAIDACNKDQGGTVLVPAGEIVIGTIEMKSNVTLLVAALGNLLGSADGKQFHAADAIPLTG